MLLINQYKCEICGALYKERDECEKCETNHKKVKGISSCSYLPYENDKTGVPYRIRVEMADGKFVEYERKSGYRG